MAYDQHLQTETVGLEVVSAVRFAQDSKSGQSFFIRDIVFFGRGALRGIPFAGRDHIVEAALYIVDCSSSLEKT